MKAKLLGFLAAGICGSVFSADIALKDGRLLKDATIVSQAPLKVTIKHAAGLGSVDKALLPPELQAQYPINEAAARAEEAQAAVALKAAQESRKVEAERIALIKIQRDAKLAANAAAEEKESGRVKQETDAITAEAKLRAETYFSSSKYSSSPVTRESCKVTLSEVRPLAGWSGRWFVKGQAAIKHYDDFRNLTKGVGVGSDQAPLGVTIDTVTRDNRWEPDYTLEVVEFEYAYSTDPKSDVVIDVRKREEMRVKGGRLRRTAAAGNTNAPTVEPAK